MTREQIEKAARDYALYQLGLVGLRFTQITLIDAAYSMLWWAIKNKFVETNKNE